MKREAKILLIADNIWLFGEGMLGPLLAVFAQRIGGDILQITWAWATYLMVQGVLAIFIGRYFDRLKRKSSKEALMLIGFIINAVFTFGYIFVHSTFSLLLVEVGLGVAAALATPTWDALYAMHTEERKNEGLSWGLEDGLSQISTGLAIVVGGFIVSRGSFNLLFVTMGILQIIATIVQFRILRSKRRLSVL
jgi:MFS family permease